MFWSKEARIKRAAGRLEASDAKVRLKALEKIGSLLAPDSIDNREDLRLRVTGFLKDSDEDVRIEALALLWKSSRENDKRLAWATELLSDRSEVARMLAAVWIAELGPAAATALVPMWKACLRSEDSFRAKEIERAIRMICSDESKLSAARKQAQEEISTGLRQDKTKLPVAILNCRHQWFMPPEQPCSLCGKVDRLPHGCRSCGVVLCQWCYAIVVS